MSVELKINNKEAVLWFYQTNDKSDFSDEADIEDILEKKHIKTVYVYTEDEKMQSLVAAEIYLWNTKLSAAGITVSDEKLPENYKDLLKLSLKPANIPPSETNQDDEVFYYIGVRGYSCFVKVCNALKFVWNVLASVMRFVIGKAVYRAKDFWFIFSDCSYQAIGITALVSFLVGLILAFVGALQLKTFGAGIYVASMVALGMTRIMAAIMVGIIMAGRTGSSYAATLGTMQVNEEIDALKTLGVQITDYLVAPRFVALTLTMPFLTLLADVLGILGGGVVGVFFLNLSSVSYIDYSIRALDLTNILVGLLHSVVYGIIISITGCYAGLSAGRDADAVGKATTSAVVSALVWMIIATGILTVVMEVLGI